MTLDEFLDLTPRFLETLEQEEMAKRKLDGRTTEIMGAQLVSMIRRCGFVQFEEERDFRDFMPSEWDRRAKQKPKQRTKKLRQQTAEAWRVYFKRAAGVTK